MRGLIFFLIVLLAGLQLKLFFGNGSFFQVHALQKEVVLQQQAVSKLKERNQILEAEVQDLKKGMSALEERARSDLGMIRSKESFYQYSLGD